MFDIILRKGLIVDPINHVHFVGDVAVENGKIVAVGEELTGSTRQEFDATGKIIAPGLVDTHTHLRNDLGHPHSQRMVALAGVTTALDMMGPLDNILDTIEGSGCGITIASIEAIDPGVTVTCMRPSVQEQKDLIAKRLESGSIGLKIIGGHVPLDLDICASFIEESAKQGAWIAWHAGNSVHGSNIEGMKDAVEAANGHFLHLAHINSYCRGKIRNEAIEALEAIEMLKANPNIFCESYVSPRNGTSFNFKENGELYSKITKTCLANMGYEPTKAGLRQALIDGKCSVLSDTGTVGELISGPEAAVYWEGRKDSKGSFPMVNPAGSRLLVATAKRDDGSFVVDCLSTDGGGIPRNVTIEVGLSMVKFGAMTLDEFILKASANGARALGLPNKGHIGIGADADIVLIDYVQQKAVTTIANGKVVMHDGKLLGKGMTVVCDERGTEYLAKRNIPFVVKQSIADSHISKRLVLK